MFKSYLQKPIQAGLPCIRENNIQYMTFLHDMWCFTKTMFQGLTINVFMIIVMPVQRLLIGWEVGYEHHLHQPTWQIAGRKRFNHASCWKVAERSCLRTSVTRCAHFADMVCWSQQSELGPKHTKTNLLCRFSSHVTILVAILRQLFLHKWCFVSNYM